MHQSKGLGRAGTGLVLVALSLISTGCASPARIERMQTDSTMAQRTVIASSGLKENIGIKDVTGGQSTNPMWVSNVSSSDFERALEASLRSAGLLSANRQASKYSLTAHMLKVEQPFMGLDMTVTATVQYSLVERTTGKEVFARTLVAPFTATVSDAFLGVERLQLANEGAMRANIQQLINAFVELKLASLSLDQS